MSLTLGTCVIVNGTGYQCSCPAGWTGVNCATQVNPCAVLPCLNNGQCITLGTLFVCVCVGGYNGTFCQVPPNPCAINPCK